MTEQRGIAEVRRLRVPRGRGPLFGLVLPVVGRIPPIAGAGLTIWLAQLGATRQT